MKNLFYLTSILLAVLLYSACAVEGEEDFLVDMTCDEWCEIYTEDGPQFDYDFEGDHGACMSLCNTCNNPSTSAASSAVCFCNWMQERIDQTDDTWLNFSDGEFKNKGECIKKTKAEINNMLN